MRPPVEPFAPWRTTYLLLSQAQERQIRAGRGT